MTAQPSEADIIFNRANVALAKSQRLVASWLPPRTEDELKNAKTEEQIEKEEQEMFTPVPEVLGLGAKIPEDFKDWDLKRQKLSSNDLLRRQLLGKDHIKSQNKYSQGQASLLGTGSVPGFGSKPRLVPARRELEDGSSEDEGGRSSLGKKKLKSEPTRISNSTRDEESEADTMDYEDPKSERPETLKPPKKTTNYLDEVLAQKMEKKHRKKKKKRDTDTTRP
ncbi:MAG: hypothetical protein Q9213_000293 [Squamulea squamosa]